MTHSKTFLRAAALISALGLVPAYAQPADRSGMQGAGMQAMMSQCADMRRQMAQGAHSNTPDMTKKMARCDEMDRGMGSMRGMGSPAPAGAPPATRAG